LSNSRVLLIKDCMYEYIFINEVNKLIMITNNNLLIHLSIYFVISLFIYLDLIQTVCLLIIIKLIENSSFIIIVNY
jgi:hypothetical protein